LRNGLAGQAVPQRKLFRAQRIFFGGGARAEPSADQAQLAGAANAQPGADGIEINAGLAGSAEQALSWLRF